MKTIVFSDTHLINKFEENKFQFLSALIASADSIIINGVFWDAYMVSFDAFIKSRWKDLFPLLKEKKTICRRILKLLENSAKAD